MSKGTVGTKLVLEGKTEYTQGLKEVDSNLKKLNSEMKVTTETFKNSQNSAQALAKKSEILNKQYDEASKKVDIYARHLQELREKEEQAAQKVETLKDKYNAANTSLEMMKKSGTATNAMMQVQQKEVDSLEKELAEANKELSQAVIKENQVETALNNACAEQLRYGTELDKTNGYLAEAEKSTNGLAKSIDGYGRETDKAGDETERLNDKLDKLVTNVALEKLSEGAKALLNTFMDCAEVAEQFGYSMAKVQSIAQVSRAELSGMSDDIRRVATDMGYSATEIAEATYQAISASVDAGEAVEFVADAAKLARAGFTETTTAVDVLTTAINAYGKEANTAAHIADDLVTTQNLGKTTVDELAQSLGTIIPTAAAYNVSLDQLSTSYVLLTKQGINTANATTYLNGMMNELADGGSMVGKILKEETGTTFGGLMREGKSLGDVMSVLNDYVDGDTEAFANLFGNVRAGKGALAIANQGAEEFNKTLKIMGENAGATDKAYATMADTAVMTNARLESSLENLKISIGDSLSPVLDKLKEDGIKVLNEINDLVKEHPALVRALAGAVVALTAGTAAVTAFAAALTLGKAAFGALLGPIGLVVAAVAGIAGVFAAAAGEAEDYAAKLKECTAEYDAAVAASEQINKSAEDYVKSAKSEAEYTDILKNKIIDLNAQENLSNSQKRELRKAVEALNQMYPELNLQIDEQTGKLADNTKGWEENLETQKKRVQLQAVSEELNSIYMQQAENARALWDADNDLAEAEEKLAEAQEKQKQIQQEYFDSMNDEGWAAEGMSEKLGEQTQIVNELSDKYEALKDSRAALQEETERLNESEQNLLDYRREGLGVTDEEIDKNGQLADSASDAAEGIKLTEEEEKKLKEIVEEATSKIEGQIGIFDEWKTKSELTFQQMQDRWNSQTEGLQQYNEDLAYVKGLIESDVDPAIKNLATSMVQMGADGAAELHEFVEGVESLKGTDKGLEDLAAAWEEHNKKVTEAKGLYEGILLEYQGYTDTATMVATDYYRDDEAALDAHNKAITTMTSNGIHDQATAITETSAQELTPAAKEAMEQMVDESEGALGIQRSGGNSTVFITIGETIPESIAQGIRNAAERATSEVKQLMESIVTTAASAIGGSRDGGNSSVFYNIGMSIPQSIASGITAGGSAVQSAMQSVMNNAVNNIDVSGITNRVNRALGEAWG